MIRREKYYYQDPQLQGDLAERYQNLTADVLVYMYLEPSLSFSRKAWGSFLWKMIHSTEPQDEGGYSSLDTTLMLLFLQQRLVDFGLALGSEIEAVKWDANKRIEDVDATPKYATWDDLVARCQSWRSEGKTIGLIHGSFDPPHIGHAGLAAAVYPYCDVLLVGFDSDTSLRDRKGADRPRVPLEARMWEMASLPTVDNVFVLPIAEQTNEAYANMYRALGITILGTHEGHPLLPTYQQRMRELGGDVITKHYYPFWSSTRMVDNMGGDVGRRFHITKDYLAGHAIDATMKARAAGYLREFPKGT